MKLSSKAHDHLIDQTLDLWQPRAQRALSREDGRQMIENMAGFFSILAEWSKAETANAANDSFDSSDPRVKKEVSHAG